MTYPRCSTWIAEKTPCLMSSTIKWTKWSTSPSYTTATPKTGNKLALLTGCFTCITASIPLAALELQFENHELAFAARPRVAFINGEKGDESDGKAASLLLRLRAESQWASNLSSLLELDYVALGWESEFSNGVHFNGKPIIPDAEGFDLNQALLSYSLTNNIELSIGREAVNLGSQRFVGTNSFWQNEQTLDMAAVQLGFGAASHISYRYVDNANRIQGEDAGANLRLSDSNITQNGGLRPPQFLGDHDHQTHLLFADVKEWDYSRVQAYFYKMHIKDARPLSNKTLGARYEYKGRLGNLRPIVNAEFSLQERPKVADHSSIRYVNLEAGFGYRSNQLTVSYELLDENSQISFVTPLASLHDFNGWVDKFLLTPAGGLQDYSVQYIWRKNPWQIDARYHSFEAADGSGSYGDEFDVDISFNITRETQILLRYGNFKSSSESYSDEERVFIWLKYNL